MPSRASPTETQDTSPLLHHPNIQPTSDETQSPHNAYQETAPDHLVSDSIIHLHNLQIRQGIGISLSERGTILAITNTSLTPHLWPGCQISRFVVLHPTEYRTPEWQLLESKHDLDNAFAAHKSSDLAIAVNFNGFENLPLDTSIEDEHDAINDLTITNIDDVDSPNMVRDAQHAVDLGDGLTGDTDVFTSQGFRIGTINPFAGISPEF